MTHPPEGFDSGTLDRVERPDIGWPSNGWVYSFRDHQPRHCLVPSLSVDERHFTYALHSSHCIQKLLLKVASDSSPIKGVLY